MTFETGSTAFMLVATSLVMLMTPGLAFFYGGLVGRKNNPLHHDPELRLSGRDHHLLVRDRIFPLLQRKSRFGYRLPRDCGQPRQGIPSWGQQHHAVFDRRNPGVSLRLVPDDVRHHHAGLDNRRIFESRSFRTLPRVPGALVAARLLSLRPHDMGAGGLLAEWGVLDFAGGIPVHNIAGMAALASVIFVGKRPVRRLETA